MAAIITVGLLAVFTAVLSQRRGMSLRQTAATTGGFILVMIAFAVVDREVHYGGALVALAALGGGMVQYGVDAHRRQARAGRGGSRL